MHVKRKMWELAAVAIALLITAVYPCPREEEKYHQLHVATATDL